MKRYRLVTLDLDGTMIQTNSILFLRSRGVLGPEVEQLHARFLASQITEAELNRLQVPSLMDAPVSRMVEILREAPLLTNIKQGIDTLNRLKLSVAMLTFNPLQIFFERYYGVDTSISLNVDIKEDHISKIHKLPKNKVDYLIRHCKLNLIDLSEVIHVGDGENDIATFEKVGLSIALNPTSKLVREKADFCIVTDDFHVVAREIEEFIADSK